MNLSKKKDLAAKALKVGKGRIRFDQNSLTQIKEAITKLDIQGLKQEGVITILPVKGRKKIVKRKTRRGPGKIKKKVSKRKQEYVAVTRKLRKYLMSLRDRGVVGRDMYWDIRKKIRMRNFKSKATMKDYLKAQEIDLDLKIEKKEKRKILKKETKKGSKPGDKK